MLASFQVISPLAVERHGVKAVSDAFGGAKASGAAKSGTAGASGTTAVKGKICALLDEDRYQKDTSDSSQISARSTIAEIIY